MNQIAFLSALTWLVTGCASRSAPPATSSTATRAQAAHASPPETQVVELRHFYLLSPGPSSKLVITRSEPTTSSSNH
jgi:hypothetical protein